MKDVFKRETTKDYTSWDLNCPHIVKNRSRGKMCHMMKRAARRTMKQKLKKSLTDGSLYDTILLQ